MIPDYRACLVSYLKNFSKKGQPEKYFEQLQSSGSQGLAYKANAAIPASWLSKVAGEGDILATWTVNTPQLALRAMEQGVNFIFTDRPAGLRAELNAELKKQP
jgi:glycerophosphoryl diester phosphodiesterase